MVGLPTRHGDLNHSCVKVYQRVIQKDALEIMTWRIDMDLYFCVGCSLGPWLNSRDEIKHEKKNVEDPLFAEHGDQLETMVVVHIVL